MVGRLNPAEVAYLSDDLTSVFSGHEKWVLWCFRHGFSAWGVHPGELWAKHKDDFLPEFIKNHPSQRPIPWWQWDAPRQPDQEGTLPLPRLRVGGKGETPWDAGLSVKPCYEKGIPASWEWIDETDPPTFESQGSYLQRQGLLTLAEKKYLEKHPELTEPETIVFDGDENTHNGVFIAGAGRYAM